MDAHTQKWLDAIRCMSVANTTDQVEKRASMVAKAVESCMAFAASHSGQMAKMLLRVADENIPIGFVRSGDQHVEYALTSGGFMTRCVPGEWRHVDLQADFNRMLAASMSLKGTEFLKDPVAALRAQLDRIADDLQRKYAKP